MMSCSDDEADVAVDETDLYNKTSECNDSYLDHQMDDLQESKQYVRDEELLRGVDIARVNHDDYAQILRSQ